MSSSECAVLALMHDKLRPPSILQNWTNVVPATGFQKGACCTWQGVGCDPASSIVNFLYIGSASLSGTIPPEVGALTGLYTLNMYRKFLTGTIPAEIASLTNLQDFAFGENNITGTIPDGIGQLRKLTTLVIDKNQLSGTIPPSIQSLSSLQWLFLGVNTLSGQIPNGIGSFSSLQVLNLANNSLSGTIPTEIGDCKGLQTMYLKMNQISGLVPEQVYSLTDLKIFALDTNSLSGTIPSSIKNLKSLTKFHIRGNFFTGLSPEITSLPISDCGLYNNPYSCLPSVPSSCVHPSLSTASKCLEPTNDDSSGRIGAVKTSEFAAILGSVFAIILLFTAGLFVFRRRKLSATPKAGKSTVKSQNDGNDTSTDTTKIRDGAAALKMDPSLSTLNLPSNFRYPSLSAAHSAPPSPYYYSNSYTTLNSSMPSNFDLCDATSPNAYSQAHSNNAMNTDAVEHLHQREFDSEYGTLYLSSHPHAGNGLESIHGRENKGEEVLFIAQEVIRP